jgi:hypothetical protein
VLERSGIAISLDSRAQCLVVGWWQRDFEISLGGGRYA